MHPRLPFGRLTDVLTCIRVYPFEEGEPRRYCQSPLFYARYAETVFRNECRFFVIDPAKVIGVYEGSFEYVQQFHLPSRVPMLKCGKCSCHLGYVIDGRYWFVHVVEQWDADERHLFGSDLFDSGNESEEEENAFARYRRPSLEFDSGAEE